MNSSLEEIDKLNESDDSSEKTPNCKRRCVKETVKVCNCLGLLKNCSPNKRLADIWQYMSGIALYTTCDDAEWIGVLN